MKKSHFFSMVMFVGVLTVVTTVKASAPQLVNYQGFLTDGAGDPLDTTVSVTFTIYDAPTAGIAIWTETQTTVVVVAGQFNVLLGSVTPLLDTVSWAADVHICPIS